MSDRPPLDPRDVERAIRDCYSTWSSTYYDSYYGAGAPYPPVHRDLLLRLLAEAASRTVLDAGCGPASFIRHLIEAGHEPYGFDLTSEMVAEARRVLVAAGADPTRVWEGDVLSEGSYRKAGPLGGFDAAVCVGVLPHIPKGSEKVVFANLRSAVRDDGLVAVEARNQLFALFTLNRYTFEFFRQELVRPEDRRTTADASRLEAALAAIQAQLRMDLPPMRTGAGDRPGYDEVLSLTHNPLVLRESFAAAGFRDVRVLFYHFHRLPPMVEAIDPARYREWSLAVEDPMDWRGHFMASAFILVGRRA